MQRLVQMHWPALREALRQFKFRHFRRGAGFELVRRDTDRGPVECLANLLPGRLGGVKDAVPFRVFAESIAFADRKVYDDGK